MVEFLFTEDNNSVDNEEQSSKYFYDVSTNNMLNNIALDILFSLIDVKHHLVFRHFISYFLFSKALFQYWFLSSMVFEIYNGVLNRPLRKKLKWLFLDNDCYGVLWINYTQNGVKER